MYIYVYVYIFMKIHLKKKWACNVNAKFIHRLWFGNKLIIYIYILYMYTYL